MMANVQTIDGPLSVEFTVMGVPMPQGSKTVYNGRAVDANAKKLRPWRGAVAVMAASQRVCFDQPVHLTATFYMPQPKRPRWRMPAVVPDLDKLVRALCDGLEDGDLVANDSRIVSLFAKKEYAVERPCVVVRLETMK